MSTVTRPRPPAAPAATLAGRDCVLLGLILVERMSLLEAAVTLGLTTSQTRRRYDAALARIRRTLAPLVGRARTPAPSASTGLRRAS